MILHDDALRDSSDSGLPSVGRGPRSRAGYDRLAQLFPAGSRTVVGDSVVNDTTFYQFRRCRQRDGEPVTCFQETELYTLDDNYAALMSRWEGPYGPVIYTPAVICRLDSPFGAIGAEWCFWGQ